MQITLNSDRIEIGMAQLAQVIMHRWEMQLTTSETQLVSGWLATELHHLLVSSTCKKGSNIMIMDWHMMIQFSPALFG